MLSSGPITERGRVDALKATVRAYAARHTNADALAETPVPGLQMMCVDAPRGDLHSIYRPLVCLVLQGASRSAAP